MDSFRLDCVISPWLAELRLERSAGALPLLHDFGDDLGGQGPQSFWYRAEAMGASTGSCRDVQNSPAFGSL